LLDHPEARATMVEGLRAVRTRLGSGGAIGRAAEAISNVYNTMGTTKEAH